MMKKVLQLLTIFLGLTALNSFGQITDPFFEHVNYRGAFGTTDWTSGWANWNPQNTNYPAITTTVSGDITTNTTWAPNSSPVFGASSFSNPNLQDPFFTPVDYVGAFGTIDWTSGWANWNPQTTSYGTAGITISGDITSNTTWTSSNIYLLNGFVYVKPGVTLTIEPGTIIRGDKATKGTLIIEKGAKINAVGTSSNPIVFTSNVAAGSRDYGDWGGIILCGKAQINIPGDTALIEGGPTAYYGGGANPDNADSSGVLKYVRIEFPGIPLQPNQEINGLTFGGVGNKTVIDYIQVSYSGDDSYEWFGGSVNAKHLIAFRGLDDEFDTDNGFSGKLQFLAGLRDPNVADVSGSNGFESDNDASGSTNLPQTSAIFCNVSLFGPKVNGSTSVNSNFKRAMHLRRNTKLSVYNSVFAGWPTGLYIDGTLTQGNAIANNLQIENCILSGMTTFFDVPAGGTWASNDERAWFMASSRNNDTLATNTQLMITDPFNLSNPNFLPSSGNTVYFLSGFVYVKPGVTLTIEPGTIVRGDKTTKGTLIIEKGAKLVAEGTRYNPIIFTSNVAAGSRDYGDWGGIILCGKAQINIPGDSALIEGGPLAYYGGGANPDNADNSGSLKYLRIEFPGIPLQPNQEINGITFGGVGNGTQIDNIQVSYSGDDSYEWFGGAVNAKHLIAFRGLDDEFDTDNGFSGKLQFLVGLRDPNVADISGSNGFESDNDAAGSNNLPQTMPTFSNVSLFGPKATSSTTINSNFKRAMHLRRNTALNAYNSIFAGWPTGLYIDGTASQGNAINNTLNISNCVLAGMVTYFDVPSGGTWAANDERSWFLTASKANDTLVNNSDLLLADPFNLNAPNFLPLASSAMLIGSIWWVDGIDDVKSNIQTSDVFPNPTTGFTNIEITNLRHTQLRIAVYDVTGRMVKTIADENVEPGIFTTGFDSADMKPGLYFVNIITATKSETIKLLKK